MRDAAVFLDALPHPAAVIDAEGGIVAVNRRWSDHEAGHADHLALEVRTRAQELSAVIREGAAGVAWGAAPVADRWFRLHAHHLRGTATALVAAVDVSGEHRALGEAAAERRARIALDEHFHRLVESVNDGIVRTNADGTIVYANSRIAAMLGFPVAELVGMTMFDVTPPDLQDEARARLERRREGVAESVEGQLLRRDGSRLDVLIGGSPVRDAEGAFNGCLALIVDTTRQKHERARMLDALRTADLDRRRLQAMLEAIPVGVWLADPTGRLVDANPAADRIWRGRAPLAASIEEYRQYRAWWRDSGRELQPDEWPLARMLSTGVAVSSDVVEFERFDGSRGYMLTTAAPILDGNGHLTGGIGVALDVTEQETAAKDREALVRTLEMERAHLMEIFERAPSFLAVLRGPHFIFERVNPAYLELVGRREIIGRPAADVFPELVDQGFRDILDRVYATGEPFVARQLPVSLKAETGSCVETRYIDIVYLRLEPPGEERTIVAHGVDVTDQVNASRRLHESEQRVRQQFDALPGATLLWEERDDDFVLVDCNAAARAILDRDRDPVGLIRKELLPHTEETRRLMQQALRDDSVVRCQQSYDYVVKGQRRTYDVTIAPLLPSRVIMHKLDVTERTELESQLRHAQKMDAIGRLAGGIAHDFNNLLTVIGAHTGFLLEGLRAADPLHEDADAIRAAADRAAALTRQLLAFSRKQLLKLQPLDLNAAVSATEAMLTRLLGEDIEVVRRLSPGLPAVMADSGQIDQVLVNLAVNARDAMPDGGVLTVATRVVTVGDGTPALQALVPDGTYVQLEVTDTGVGMDATVQARLFEPFFTTKGPGRGTGLGLATVYGIVKQSGGCVTLRSAPGLGASFSVYLPAAPVRQATPLPPPRSVTPPSGGSERILLVEDDPGVRQVARQLLTRLGYAVLEAADGESAIALAAAHRGPIDLVISDVVMPRMSGTDVVGRLRATRPGLRALLMSGYTDNEIVRRGIASLSLPFIQKPFSAADFARAVRDVLTTR